MIDDASQALQILHTILPLYNLPLGTMITEVACEPDKRQKISTTIKCNRTAAIIPINCFSLSADLKRSKVK